MKSKLIYFIFGFILSLSIMFFIRKNKTTPNIREPDIKEIVKDSLIRDSIYLENDSIVKEIQYIKIEHEKEISAIMDNSDSANFKFFTEYIKNYNNQRAIENN